MNKYKIGFVEFAQDLYDLMGMNGITQEQFFHKYVATDRAFQIDEYKDGVVIYFDDLTITIKPN